MLGESATIRKYRKKLTPELSKRYGFNGPYTQAQVDTTVRELRLNDRYIRYAYLMFCEQEVLEQEQVSESAILKMQDVVAATVGGGIAAWPIDAMFGDGGGDGGGFGDGGGGGGDG